MVLEDTAAIRRIERSVFLGLAGFCPLVSRSQKPPKLLLPDLSPLHTAALKAHPHQQLQVPWRLKEKDQDRTRKCSPLLLSDWWQPISAQFFAAKLCGAQSSATRDRHFDPRRRTPHRQRATQQFIAAWRREEKNRPRIYRCCLSGGS